MFLALFLNPEIGLAFEAEDDLTCEFQKLTGVKTSESGLYVSVRLNW